MTNPYDKAYELARALRESEEIGRLRELRGQIKADADAERMLSDFRARKAELQKKILEGGTPDEEETKRMEKLYDVITLNLLIRNLLEAERRLAILMDDIQRIINEPLRELAD